MLGISLLVVSILILIYLFSYGELGLNLATGAAGAILIGGGILLFIEKSPYKQYERDLSDLIEDSENDI